MIHKLTIDGHVRGRPHQKVQSYYSSPQGMSLVESCILVVKFNRAFVLARAVFHGKD